jgi:hypothetical protein
MEYDKLKQMLADLVDIADKEFGHQETDILISLACNSDKRLIAVRPMWQKDNVINFPQFTSFEE